MRVIKFRGWDRDQKEMFEVSPVWFEENYWRDMDYSKCTDICGIELMQFTGLQDKNDKPIFEGDWVKAPAGVFRIEWIEAFLTFCPFTAEEWKWFKDGNNHFKYYRNDDDRCYFLHDYESYELEVIGNIYENPELLEQS